MNEYERTAEEAAQLGQEVGAKFDGGKSRWDLMPSEVLIEISKHPEIFKGLYVKEAIIPAIRSKMLFHYSNGMEAAWNFWNRSDAVPFSVAKTNPLIFSCISYFHLLDLALTSEVTDTKSLLDHRKELYELEIPEVSAFYLMSYRVLNYLGDIYLYGSKKYDENNWRKGMKWGKIFAAFNRHSGQWLNGESYDKESGMHHLGHALWQLLALRAYEKNMPEFDDRWKQESDQGNIKNLLLESNTTKN